MNCLSYGLYHTLMLFYVIELDTCVIYSYGTLFLSHIAEDITDSLTFTGDRSLLLLVSSLIFPFFYIFNFLIPFYS